MTIDIPSISERAMLVRLNLSAWTARKHDRRISEEVASQHGAACDAGRYNKQLVAKERLDKIGKIRSSAYAAHCKLTLPWSDEGYRVLLTQHYFDYTTEIAQCRNEYETAVRDFLSDWPEIVAEAQARLGGMYDPADYPTDIASRFAFQTGIRPIPTGADFRVKLDDDAIAAVQRSVQASVERDLAVAARNAWQRVHDAVAHMVERLESTRYDKSGTIMPGIFHNSTIDHVRELAELLPGLNLLADPEMDRAARALGDLVRGLSADTLRTDTTARKQTAAEAKKVLDNFSSFFGQ